MSANLNHHQTLEDLVDNTATDKNTTHSYLSLYESLLFPRQQSTKHVLEIGVGDFKEKNGGSIKLWKDYFPHATIYGVDVLGPERVIDDLLQDERIVLHLQKNAYDEHVFQELFLDKNIQFDVMIDDGPHTLQTMVRFIQLYSQLLSEDGILIIEDVQSIEWLDRLKQTTPQHLQPYIKTFDLRHIKGRYDDIVFVIDKKQT